LEDLCIEARPFGGRGASDLNGLFERWHRDFPGLVDLLAADGGIEVEISLNGGRVKPEVTRPFVRRFFWQAGIIVSWRGSVLGRYGLPGF